MAGVLHVCTANVIRSPIAEVLTRQYLPGYPIGSAGLRACPGQPLWPAAAVELARRGVPVPMYGAFRSRPLSRDLAARADLVLTATRRHRDAVVASSPCLLGRVFTWRELAWLTSSLTPEDVPGTAVPDRIAGMLDLVPSRRGHLVAPPGDEFDVADPVDGPEALLFEVIDQIEAALAAVLPLLAVPAAAPPGAAPTQGADDGTAPGADRPAPPPAPDSSLTSPLYEASPPPPPADDPDPPLGTLLPTGFAPQTSSRR
jgi:protein-tyrosine phosphatase